MSKNVHRIYISTLVGIVVFVTIYIGCKGYSYYSTPMLDRFYHPDHQQFKAAGLYGHGLGIIGTLLIFIGVVMYLIRKRSRSMARWGRLKYWLEFHIFLCTLGPIMVLYHTAFKIGGVVSIAFWSMVAVVVSGVIGRYIYIQIPRSIEGRELSLNEIQNVKNHIHSKLNNDYGIDAASQDMIFSTLQLQTTGGVAQMERVKRFFENRKKIIAVKKILKQNQLPRKDIRSVVALVKDEMAINKKIERLQTMQALFKYWHVAHLPFAIIMLVIVVVHVVVTFALGYKWIFE